ncbi:hypothetical protein CAOG_010080 [Capsaspora owczarzaki ATCC 30864]|uniref:P-type Cu(+) transporter n=1 Tax=Capsaspora owczarzaki (strain ATCC 30864) TaxID=595528 RepID=A0A0D2UQ62_CAPO3|nr:hypothetical protein CAOG_010080 [Capsaspora owczarzaki ATCC 30864]
MSSSVAIKPQGCECTAKSANPAAFAPERSDSQQKPASSSSAATTTTMTSAPSSTDKTSSHETLCRCSRIVSRSPTLIQSLVDFCVCGLAGCSCSNHDHLTDNDKEAVHHVRSKLLPWEPTLHLLMDNIANDAKHIAKVLLLQDPQGSSGGDQPHNNNSNNNNTKGLAESADRPAATHLEDDRSKTNASKPENNIQGVRIINNRIEIATRASADDQDAAGTLAQLLALLQQNGIQARPATDNAPPVLRGQRQSSLARFLPARLASARNLFRSASRINPFASRQRAASTSTVNIELVHVPDTVPQLSTASKSPTGTPARRVALSVDGMTCASCVNSIESAIQVLPGVLHVTVSLLAGRCDVDFDPSKEAAVSEESICAAINDMGFDASILPPPRESGKAVLEVTGMTCASCVASIEQSIGRLPGVESIAINLLGATAHVSFAPETTNLRTIIEAIDDMGFGASLRKGTSASAEAKHRRELEIVSLRRQFLFSLALTIPIFLIGMLFELIGGAVWEPFETKVVRGVTVQLVILLVLTTIVQFGVGKRFYFGAFNALKHRTANMDVLVAIGITAAYAVSVLVIILRLVDPMVETMQYFETSAMLITFIVMGKYLEARAKGKTSEALTKLFELQPSTAVLLELEPSTTKVDENSAADSPAPAARVYTEKHIPIELVNAGDLLKVLPGAKMPVDGVVVWGTASVDESMITGESLPVTKSVDSPVTGGTVNLNGALHIRATRVGEDSTLAQITTLIENAQASKAPIQALADKVAGRFVPVVVSLALATFVVWLVGGPRGRGL